MQSGMILPHRIVLLLLPEASLEIICKCEVKCELHPIWLLVDFPSVHCGYRYLLSYICTSLTAVILQFPSCLISFESPTVGLSLETDVERGGGVKETGRVGGVESLWNEEGQVRE